MYWLRCIQIKRAVNVDASDSLTNFIFWLTKNNHQPRMQEFKKEIKESLRKNGNSNK
jgi:hypothetical protein